LIRPFAAEVGLAASTLPWHAHRKPIADVLSLLSFIAGALGTMTADVQRLTRSEAAEVTEPAVDTRVPSTVSVQLPNPSSATLILSVARQVKVFAALPMMSMLTEEESASGSLQAEWRGLRECLRLTGGATHAAVKLYQGLDIHLVRTARDLRTSQPGDVIDSTERTELGSFGNYLDTAEVLVKSVLENYRDSAR
jgi:nitrosuccinate lyase